MTLSAIYPYKMGSRSATALSQALKIPQIRHKNSKFVGGAKKIVINWGSGNIPGSVDRSRVVNRPEAVIAASNKLSFFRLCAKAKGPRTVPWATDRKEALDWIIKGGNAVARTSLTGHSGYGILIAGKVDDLAEAKLYTKYIPKDSEWRVHVAFGEIIDVQRKVRDPETEPKDWKVRSHDNGFIFIRETAPPSDDVLVQARLAYEVSGLDFGAVDVVFNRKLNQAFVLEVNTAPGLSGTTIESYANAFLKRFPKST